MRGGFSWSGQAPASWTGRIGVMLLLFLGGGVLIVFMLVLSLLSRAVFGGRQQQDS